MKRTTAAALGALLLIALALPTFAGAEGVSRTQNQVERFGSYGIDPLGKDRSPTFIGVRRVGGVTMVGYALPGGGEMWVEKSGVYTDGDAKRGLGVHGGMPPANWDPNYPTDIPLGEGSSYGSNMTGGGWGF